GIRGLQPNAGAFVIEALAGRLLLGSEPHRHRLPVLAGLLMAEDDDVSVVDERVDHRHPLYPQREEPVGARADQIAADVDGLRRLVDHDVIEDWNRLTGGDLPDHRDLNDIAHRYGTVDQFDPARDVAVAADQIPLLQDVEVVVHNTRGRNIKIPLNLANGWRIGVLLQEPLDILEHHLLSSRERLTHPPPHLRAERANDTTLVSL